MKISARAGRPTVTARASMLAAAAMGDWTYSLSDEACRGSDLLPKGPEIRFIADEQASWDGIAENAFKLAREFGNEKITAVVLVYEAACNPLHVMDLEMLRRARLTLQGFPSLLVAGTVIIPQSEVCLQAAGVAPRLGFETRVAVARCVLAEGNEQDWVVVDPCREGCLFEAGDALPFLASYARARLHGNHLEPRMLRVCAEDALSCPEVASRVFGELRVPPTKDGPCVALASLRERSMSLEDVSAIIVEMPKRSDCDEILRAAVRQCSSRAVEPMALLERLCGSKASRLIVLDCVNTPKPTFTRRYLL